MKNVMLDFETFGNGKNACVVQVGACFFNKGTGEIGKTFLQNVDAKSAVRSGADMDAEPIYWWLKQSKEAIESVTKPPLMDIRDVFSELNDFLEDVDNIWSHATFDFVILQETLKRLNIKPKFSYRSARDIRTLNYLSKVSTKEPMFVRQGIHHSALDDCIFQVTYCVHAMKMLGSL